MRKSSVSTSPPILIHFIVAWTQNKWLQNMMDQLVVFHCRNKWAGTKIYSGSAFFVWCPLPTWWQVLEATLVLIRHLQVAEGKSCLLTSMCVNHLNERRWKTHTTATLHRVCLKRAPLAKRVLHITELQCPNIICVYLPSSINKI